nr:MAG: ORF1 [TTV-like mini virus]
MPWWRTRRYHWRNRRRRRFWSWRPGRPFRRRWWRRKHRPVRKKKLKKLRLTQWQPHYIRKLTVMGFYPMFMATSDRLSNILNCYLETTTPHYMHGGGGFSISNFSLMTLYLEHLQVRNWWTVSNQNMPLIRYLGCTMYLYKMAEYDYLFYYNNQPPMNATLTTYQSTHPAAMLLNKNTRKITCKRYNKKKKPYTKLKIKPPPQLQNKWYFQYDIADTPLLQTMCTACSFDRMFLNSTSVSSTIGFISLDTRGFLNHYWTSLPTSGYQPKPGTLLFAIENGETEASKIKYGDLIFMANTKDLTAGIPIRHVSTQGTFPTNITTDWQKKLYNARTKTANWGNPFKSSYFWGDQRLLETNKTWEQIITAATSADTQIGDGWVFKTLKTFECRYNPFADKGSGNIVYLLKINSGLHATDWGPPADADVVTQDLPLWLLTWGYLDFQRNCKEYRDIDTTCICVIQSPYIFPKTEKFYVPLDYDFLNGNSPYRPEGHIIPSDEFNWHPKVAFQTRSINSIASCGPATVKLPKDISCESHVRYRFYFKVGGQPPPMSILTNPTEQPKYPIPNNLISTPSLQSPATPIEQLLWSFDERRQTLTKTATQRITDYKPTESSLLQITDPSSYCPTATLFKEKEASETESSEEEIQTPIQEQLNKQRRKQKQLRQQIKLLLNRLINIE